MSAAVVRGKNLNMKSGRQKHTVVNHGNTRYPTIWKYGDIEFFFEPYRRDGYLYMVYFDAFNVPKGWGQLVVEPWVICNRLTKQDGEAALRTENINYHTSAAPDPDCVNVVTSSGVVLQFVVNQPDQYSFPVGLFAVSKQLAEVRPLTQEAK